ncbi:hypothetical protein FACS189425_05120 [Clostridia bacterium]|nr:hypothetical protein FACS189425_05120 [Clostridia bacterium]
MRKALIVGVNFYHFCNCLSGCVPDAYAVNAVLEQHSDGTRNFDVELKVATDQTTTIDRVTLKNYVNELFKDDCEVALFYFSGHGYIESAGGFLITSECKNGDDGFPMSELLTIVNNSPARNKIIVIDTCFSGQVGNPSVNSSNAYIKEGVTILTASQGNQTSVDEGDGSTFTKLFVDALSGAAANLLGDVSPGGVYAHIDQSLGAWQQRPIFKTNVKNFVSLRTVQPPIAISDLRKITELFPDSFEFKLDPTFEPEEPSAVKENTEKFAILQKFNRVNLVVPVEAEHMYFAAIHSKSCKLTVVGEYYWKLVKNKRI